MSKRIADTYKNFLAYEDMRNKRLEKRKKSQLSASVGGGLLSRKNASPQKAAVNSNLSEVDKVLGYIENIRKYRMS